MASLRETEHCSENKQVLIIITEVLFGLAITFHDLRVSRRTSHPPKTQNAMWLWDAGRSGLSLLPWLRDTSALLVRERRNHMRLGLSYG